MTASFNRATRGKNITVTGANVYSIFAKGLDGTGLSTAFYLGDGTARGSLENAVVRYWSGGVFGNNGFVTLVLPWF